MTVADKFSLKLGLIWMLIVFMALYAGFEMAPFELGAFKGNFVRPDFKPTHAMELALQTWDAQHYLFLAEHGYQAGHRSSAFYPLYPLLVSLLACLFGSAWIMACALSAFCAITGLVVFRRIGARLKTEASSRDSPADERLSLSTLLLLCFPSAFFMYLPYSEAMFF